MEIVRNLQRLRGIDDADDDDSGSNVDRIGRRRTIHNLEKQKQKKRITGTLDVAFKKRFFNMTAEGGDIEGEKHSYSFILLKKISGMKNWRRLLVAVSNKVVRLENII